MKKLMTLMLGAALAIGSVSVYAAQADQKETPKKTKSTKKSTKAPKKDGAPSK